MIQKLCQLLGIQHTRTTSYHPQGNGQVAANAMLAKVVGQHHRDWDKHLYKRLCLHTGHHFMTRQGIHHICMANFGLSPALPVDVMSHWADLKKTVTELFLNTSCKDAQRTLKSAYNTMHTNLEVAH